MSDASGASGEVELVQLLTPEGERREHPVYSFSGDDDQIKSFYHDMVLTRRVDSEATALQRQGELGLWASCLGQEAAQVGSGRALGKQDYVFPTYREHGVAIRSTCWPCSAELILAVGTLRRAASTSTRSLLGRKLCMPPAMRWRWNAMAWSAPAIPTATWQ